MRLVLLVHLAPRAFKVRKEQKAPLATSVRSARRVTKEAPGLVVRMAVLEIRGLVATRVTLATMATRDHQEPEVCKAIQVPSERRGASV